MGSVFNVVTLDDVPGPHGTALLLTPVLSLDAMTAPAARREIRELVPGSRDAVVLDLTPAVVTAHGVRVVADLLERADHSQRPCAVVGAPHWLQDLALRLDLARPRFHERVSEAVTHMRAAAAGAWATGEAGLPGVGAVGRGLSRVGR